MEPERQIEKLLRAFAKKRRTGGEDAFKLQPRVRRRFHDEVTKQYAGPDEESLSLWQLFRQQWALLVGFALFIFLGASLFVPALSKAKHQAKSIEAMSQLQQIGVAAQMAAADNDGRLPATLDALTNGYIRGGTLTDPSSGKSFVYVAGGDMLDDLRTNSVLAYSPATGKQRAVLFADGSVQMMNEASFEAVNRLGLGQHANTLELAANAPATATAPALAARVISSNVTGFAGSGAVGGELALAKASTLSPEEEPAAPANSRTDMAKAAGAAPAALQPGQRFVNQAVLDAGAASIYFRGTNSMQELEQAKAKTESAPSVLTSFELRQNGNAIAIVDRDGSIYSGFVMAGYAEKQPATEPVAPASTPRKDQTVQNIHFRVSGENQSLKKSIVFVGDVISVSNSVSTDNAAQQLSSETTRITGTATIGTTNIIQVDAVPAVP